MARLSVSVLFGIWVGIFINSAAWHGVEYLFPPDDTNSWGGFFWGQHWLLRSAVSLVATFAGGVAAGLAASERPLLSGTLSAMPTILAWLVGIYTLWYARPQEFELPARPMWWVACLALVALSPLAGRAGGAIGGTVRQKNAGYFGRYHKPVGLYWLHWLWVWVPLYFLLSEFFFSAVLTIRIDLRGSGFLWDVARLATGAAAWATAYGSYKAILVLANSERLSVRRKLVNLAMYFVLIPGAAILTGSGFLYVLVHLSP